MASSIAPNIVSDSLILYLDAVNPKSYSSGTTWFDLSKSNINGTFNNGVSFSSDSLLFDGVDDYVDIGTSIKNYSVFTTSFWIKYVTFNPTYQSPLGDVSQEFSYHVLLFNSIIYLGFSSGFIGNSYVGLFYNNFNINEWCNFVITKDSSNNVTFYQNGFSLGTINYSGNSNINYIGKGYVHDNAKISNVMFYNRSLSSSEVSINYESIKTRYQL